MASVLVIIGLHNVAAGTVAGIVDSVDAGIVDYEVVGIVGSEAVGIVGSEATRNNTCWLIPNKYMDISVLTH